MPGPRWTAAAGEGLRFEECKKTTVLFPVVDIRTSNRASRGDNYYKNRIRIPIHSHALMHCKLSLHPQKHPASCPHLRRALIVCTCTQRARARRTAHKRPSLTSRASHGSGSFRFRCLIEPRASTAYAQGQGVPVLLHTAHGLERRGPLAFAL